MIIKGINVEIPDNLVVEGDLIIRNEKVAFVLPAGLKVYSNLVLKNTKIKKLPKRLTVSKGIFLKNSAVSLIEQGLRLGGTLDLTNTKNLKSLPSGLIVPGVLNLKGSSVSKLPQQLMVGWLAMDSITVIPNDIKVRNYVDVGKATITKAPDHVKLKNQPAELKETFIEFLKRSE